MKILSNCTFVIEDISYDMPNHKSTMWHDYQPDFTKREPQIIEYWSKGLDFWIFSSIVKFFALVVNPGVYLGRDLKGTLILHRENQII